MSKLDHTKEYTASETYSLFYEAETSEEILNLFDEIYEHMLARCAEMNKKPITRHQQYDNIKIYLGHGVDEEFERIMPILSEMIEGQNERR